TRSRLRFLHDALPISKRGDFIGGLVTGDGVFAFLVRGGGAIEQWIHRPWGRSSAVFRGSGADIELGDTGCTLTQGGAEAVGAGIAAADNDNFLALGRDSGVGIVALIDAVLPGEVFHRRVDAVKLTAFDRKFARDGRAGG